ncbi:MAG: hypothetical protein H6739_01740 [Alphaproteobacteria bacterium]|nr:hypothetical protein [Alphaproteobacteria bacterium]
MSTEPEPAPDLTARILAVLLLVAMVIFSVTGDRDDKAWEAMTDPVKDWWGDHFGG